jgi:ethanolamine ammonia-lyase small subunit
MCATSGPAVDEPPAPAPVPAADGAGAGAPADAPGGDAAAWARLRQFTPARIALGRTGDSLPTRALLEFSRAQAQARDAVHEASAQAEVHAQLVATGFTALDVHSAAADRSQYLRRPDLGRRLDAPSRERLQQWTAAHRGRPLPEIVFVIADGLSARAGARHALPLLHALREHLPAAAIGPVVIADLARVALGDEIGELLGARQVAVLIGERPGLSAPDSLGVYLTHAPRLGRTDAERNCLSNIRPEGLGYAAAAQRLCFLMAGAVRLGRSGVDLKDDSPALLAAEPAIGRDADAANPGNRPG